MSAIDFADLIKDGIIPSTSYLLRLSKSLFTPVSPNCCKSLISLSFDNLISINSIMSLVIWLVSSKVYNLIRVTASRVAKALNVSKYAILLDSSVPKLKFSSSIPACILFRSRVNCARSSMTPSFIFMEGFSSSCICSHFSFRSFASLPNPSGKVSVCSILEVIMLDAIRNSNIIIVCRVSSDGSSPESATVSIKS